MDQDEATVFAQQADLPSQESVRQLDRLTQEAMIMNLETHLSVQTHMRKKKFRDHRKLLKGARLFIRQQEGALLPRIRAANDQNEKLEKTVAELAARLKELQQQAIQKGVTISEDESDSENE